MHALLPLRGAAASRSPLGAALLLFLVGCQAAPDREAIRAMPADTSLDARGLGRGGAADRPARVQVQAVPDRGATLHTVSPRLQTGSPTSLPMIVSSLGAERVEATRASRPSLLVTVSNARGYGGFARAATRQDDVIPVQVLERRTDCGGAGGCLYVETLLLALPEDGVRRAVEAGTGLRIRINGNASFVEAAVPAGHFRALAESLGRPAGA
ncbi:hypothetical protein [Muricoccus radiodurans]|uniref:hypothetical protein n=1 Tax=Muricoccus radiodurans TaxID=2231721 RepID=UPI003CFA510B